MVTAVVVFGVRLGSPVQPDYGGVLTEAGSNASRLLDEDDSLSVDAAVRAVRRELIERSPGFGVDAASISWRYETDRRIWLG
ncbi:MAG: hypothetical protein RBS39_01505 [Phycisphaerales bacterium]|nr:hypothetical protein [Phycisphaerales bacterium]